MLGGSHKGLHAGSTLPGDAAAGEKLPESYPGEALSNLLSDIEAIKAKLGDPIHGRKLKAEWWQVLLLPYPLPHQPFPHA